MNISYLGHLSIAVKSKNASLVFNPFDKGFIGFNCKKVESDIVLSSEDSLECSDYTKVSDDAYIIKSPGEYEVNGVMILGFPMMEKAPDLEGRMINTNTIYRVEIAGINICHLGSLKRGLKENEIDEIGSVDVLILPVGNDKFIDNKIATSIVNKIEPVVVIPVAYYDEAYSKKFAGLSSIEKFLESMGASKPETESFLRIKRSDIDDQGEGTRVVILERKI
jgi:L-ascorbate metabolism protein UlaG (beta-lactamase superfamily)